MRALVYGHGGWVGNRLSRELLAAGWDVRVGSRKCVSEDMGGFDLVVNAAGCTGVPNVDALEAEKVATLLGNAVLPVRIAEACERARVPLMHIGSGCVYTHPTSEEIKWWTEEDKPNFTASVYSLSKVLAEAALAQYERVWILRIRMPFTNLDEDRNYLTKLQRYGRVWSDVNSITDLDEFAKEAVRMWEYRVPWGIYNMTNPGCITGAEVCQLIGQYLGRRDWSFFTASDFAKAVKAPRSNCCLDVTKAQKVGIRLRPVYDAVEMALQNWRVK